MCLVLFARSARPTRGAPLPLVVLANRDEFFARPTAASDFWGDGRGERTVLAGRDLEKGGTWLGVTRAGRFACVTNVRAPAARREGRSRGALVADFLAGEPVGPDRGDAPARDYLRALRAEEYPSFNALFFDGEELLYARDDDAPGAATGLRFHPVADGVHGVSNGRLDDPWPKVVRGVARLTEWLEGPMDLDDAFDLLADREAVDDGELPHTGVPLELERALAPAFVALPGYGTRASTVVVLHASGELSFAERAYGERGRVISERRESWRAPLG
ncbi:MAG: NRDE family protein [Myxococcales bacterium]|nr:NRDE family protein [Myxococcales bacterium]MBL0198048.1 NRDE family protein [Myxococcales bacterium]HQY62090.1 NRDE family protein [Polyangiaceae bacterium]